MQGRYVDLLKHTLQLGAGLGFAWLFFDCVQALTSANPERLKALATVITSMSLDRVVPWILSGGLGIAYAQERAGKKRLVRKLAAKRGEVEQDDAYAGSSGLNETGDTPTIED